MVKTSKSLTITDLDTIKAIERYSKDLGISYADVVGLALRKKLPS